MLAVRENPQLLADGKLRMKNDTRKRNAVHLSRRHTHTHTHSAECCVSVGNNEAIETSLKSSHKFVCTSFSDARAAYIQNGNYEYVQLFLHSHWKL